MIVINLAPPEELENRYWYAFDLLIFCFSFLLFLGMSQIYIQHVENKITSIEAETKETTTQIAQLAPSLKRFDEIHHIIESEERNLRSIQNITTSKISRYEPVVLLEYLQTLKPDGVWISYIEEKSESATINLTGGAFNHTAVAEFMTALSETQYAKHTNQDVRSLVYFTMVTLERVSKESGSSIEKSTEASDKINTSSEPPHSSFSSNEMKGFITFSLILSYSRGNQSQEKGS